MGLAITVFLGGPQRRVSELFERLSQRSQSVLNVLCERMRATKHAARGPCRLPERINGLIEIQYLVQHRTHRGALVDHRAYDNASAAACAFDYCYREPQHVADAAIDDVCRRAKCEMTARTYNRPGVFRNCWRQF